jgi:hypothetical protein
MVLAELEGATVFRLQRDAIVEWRQGRSLEAGADAGRLCGPAPQRMMRLMRLVQRDAIAFFAAAATPWPFTMAAILISNH